MSLPIIPIARLVAALSHETRWRVLYEFMKEEVSLPSSELARRIGISQTAMGKHVKILYQAGILVSAYGSHYKIPTYYRVPGEKTLDLGVVVLRLDRLDGVGG